MTGPAHEADDARAAVEPDQRDFTKYYLSVVITVVVVGGAAAAAVGITHLARGTSARVFVVPAAEALPEPHLQLDPESELHELRRRNARRLTSYGYVDRGAGIVHIPIAEAMSQLRARGLPTRATSSPESPP
jgi:hypothetical protein